MLHVYTQLNKSHYVNRNINYIVKSCTKCLALTLRNKLGKIRTSNCS